MKSDFSFEIKIVYDDICAQPGFLTDFGFSALIYNNLSKTHLLFDTGTKGDILIHNINKFNVKVSEIKKVIISHNHFDHAGGLKEIYQLNHDIEIYVPFRDMKSFMGAYPEAQVQGISEMVEVDKNIFSSGQFGDRFLKEQSLFLKTEKNDLIIISGCAHPGLETFILKGRTISNKIKAVIGGFHGFRNFSFLEGIEFVGACHCTQRIREIKQRFPEQFKDICVGNSYLF
jgi:7,8-dihydropterin-6-yl-methyl-4-(beta-D-ribofuranosyl)aminobenzene 5'-phosphate synthase